MSVYFKHTGSSNKSFATTLGVIIATSWHVKADEEEGSENGNPNDVSVGGHRWCGSSDADTDGSVKAWEDIPVHAVLMSASCESPLIFPCSVVSSRPRRA